VGVDHRWNGYGSRGERRPLLDEARGRRDEGGAAVTTFGQVVGPRSGRAPGVGVDDRWLGVGAAEEEEATDGAGETEPAGVEGARADNGGGVGEAGAGALEVPV
jgi:hypothetical protein